MTQLLFLVTTTVEPERDLRQMEPLNGIVIQLKSRGVEFRFQHKVIIQDHSVGDTTINL